METNLRKFHLRDVFVVDQQGIGVAFEWFLLVNGDDAFQQVVREERFQPPHIPIHFSQDDGIRRKERLLSQDVSILGQILVLRASCKPMFTMRSASSQSAAKQMPVEHKSPITKAYKRTTTCRRRRDLHPGHIGSATESNLLARKRFLKQFGV